MEHQRSLKIVTWNVNGLNSLECYFPKLLSQGPTVALAQSFESLLDLFDADVICFQETKLLRGTVSHALAFVPGYDAFFSFCQTKKGYSGVATYCRYKRQTSQEMSRGNDPSGADSKDDEDSFALPIQAQDGFTGLFAMSPEQAIVNSDIFAPDFSEQELRELDREGRTVVTDHGHFVLFNVYFPNGHAEDEKRWNFKLRFHDAIGRAANWLVEQGRHVIIAGDVNSTRQPIDHCDPLGKEKHCSMWSGQLFAEHPVRKWFHRFVEDGGGGFVDVFRAMHPDQKAAYTCWNTKLRSRESNYGTRLDYFLADKALTYMTSGTPAPTTIGEALIPPPVTGFLECNIMASTIGSDHCPVVAVLAPHCLSPPLPPHKSPPFCAKYMPEFAGKQQSLLSFFGKKSASSSISSDAPPSPTELSNLPEQGGGRGISLMDIEDTFGLSEGDCDDPPALSRGTSSRSDITPSFSSHGEIKTFRGVSNSVPSASTVRSSSGTSWSSNLSSRPMKRKQTSSTSGASAGSQKQMNLSSFFKKSSQVGASDTARPIDITHDDSPVKKRKPNEPSPVEEKMDPSSPRPDSSAPDAPSPDPFLSPAPSRANNQTKSPPAVSSPTAFSNPTQSWKNLLNGAPPVPLCKGHNLPALLFTTNKKGANQGRKFYCCALTGEARCKFFQWVSSKSSAFGNTVKSKR